MADFNPGSALPRLQPLPQGVNDQTIVQLHRSIMTVYQSLTALNNQLTYMFEGHLDVANIRAEGIETENLKAGAVTADKITVDELSAISADLGHITAGLVEAIKMVGSMIIGSYIGTKEPGLYPRTEMSVTGGYFGAFESEDKAIRIIEDYLGQGVSLSFFDTGFGGGSVYMSGGRYLYINAISDMVIESGTDIEFKPGGTRGVIVPDWYKVYNKSNGRTLGQELSDIFSNFGVIAGQINAIWIAINDLQNNP